MVKLEQIKSELTETLTLTSEILKESSLSTFDVIRYFLRFHWPSRKCFFVDFIEVSELVLHLNVLLIVCLQIESRLTQAVKSISDCFNCIRRVA